jgi:hypothetical protein
VADVEGIVLEGRRSFRIAIRCAGTSMKRQAIAADAITNTR